MGLPRAIAVQPKVRAIKRKGSRCDATNKVQAAINRKRNKVDDSGSFEKLVTGATDAMMPSWRVEKSSMLFCRSRMLRKKSFDISEAGLIVRGGERGGPPREYWEVVTVNDGGGGCRARKAGTNRAKSARIKGNTERRYGSRQTNVYTASRERVCEETFQERSRMTRF